MSSLFERVAARYRAGRDPVGDQRIDGIADFRPAAVLIAITDEPEPHVLLLHRPSNMRAHPGQVAFPGGKIDPGESPVEAALREAWEELGIPPDVVSVVGESDLYRTHSGFAIAPVLGVIPSGLTIRPNPAEVAQWFAPPLAYILDPANHREAWTDWRGAPRMYYEIDWQGHRIWGVTAALIVNLARRLRWHD